MKYRILQQCTIQNRLLYPGYEIDTDLMPVYSDLIMDDAVTLGQAEKIPKPAAGKKSLKDKTSETSETE